MKNDRNKPGQADIREEESGLSRRGFFTLKVSGNRTRKLYIACQRPPPVQEYGAVG